MTDKDKVYSIGVVGIGTSGAFTCLRLSTHHKDKSVIAFDSGRPPAKRRLQMIGFLGLLPNSDGKLYSNDIDKVAEIIGDRKTKSALTYFKKELSKVNDMKIIKDNLPSINTKKKITKNDYDIVLNDHIQMYPNEIHLLSKNITEIINKNKNINFQYDTEVLEIHKQKNLFVICTEDKEYKCKKLIISVGRSGWKWVSKNIYEKFGIIEENDKAHFGVRVEMSAQLMKDFNQSHCTLTKNDIEVGPFSWKGSIIPEDHGEMVISAFRGNEGRWESDKVSFAVIGHKNVSEIKTKQTENWGGYQQTNRIGELTFLETNERVAKERVSTFMRGNSKVKALVEYGWVKDVILDLKNIIPDIITKGYFHVPTIVPIAPKINIGTDLSTEVSNLYVAGESTGVVGLMGAALMGITVADSVGKG